MAFEITPLTKGSGPVDMVTVDRHWYLTEDRSRVVEEGDPAGRWLWASPGSEVPRAEAERLGAIKTREPEASKEAAKPADKQLAKPGDKQRPKGDDKASVDDLRQRATDLGVQVDNRWGAARLQQEIAAVEAEN